MFINIIYRDHMLHHNITYIYDTLLVYPINRIGSGFYK